MSQREQISLRSETPPLCILAVNRGLSTLLEGFSEAPGATNKDLLMKTGTKRFCGRDSVEVVQGHRSTRSHCFWPSTNLCFDLIIKLRHYIRVSVEPEQMRLEELLLLLFVLTRSETGGGGGWGWVGLRRRGDI